MVQLLWFRSCRAWYGDYFIIMVRYFKSYCHSLWICARGWYIQLKGHHMGLQNSMAHGPVYFGLKAVGPYMDTLLHNDWQIFQELLSFHMQVDHNIPNSGARPKFGTISKTSRFLSQIFRNPDFCSKFPENPNTFTKKMLNSTNYTVVLDYLRQNLNMQPFIVLNNQNIPDFYFLRRLF